MNNYLLIANNTYDFSGKVYSSLEIANYRLDLGYWGLYEHTPHRKILAEGDKVIVYLAGSGTLGKHFLAQATIKQVTEDRKVLGKLVGDPPIAAIEIVDINRFAKPVLITSIKEKLRFIPQGTPKWGGVLQRGVKRISQEDFETILMSSK